MNDLLIVAIPFVAFVLLFVAWLAQSRKPASVRTIPAPQPARASTTTAEANLSATQQPA